MDLDPALLLLIFALALLGVAGLIAGLRAQRARPVSGPEGFVGQRGIALTTVEPHHPGQVFVRGEIWEALPDGAHRIEAQEAVAVVRLEGLTARVAPAAAP